MRQGVQHRELHTRHTDLCENTAVDELDERVHDALGMNHYLESVVRQTEQKVGFDDLEGLVRERCTVDRDLSSHAPRGMPQRILERGALELLRRPLTKRPTRRRDDNATNIDSRTTGDALK